MIIGRSETYNSKDRLIYTDLHTGKIMVETKAISLYDVRHFIEEHIIKREKSKEAASALLSSKASKSKRGKLDDGIITPKFILKFVAKNGSAETKVYYDKNLMLADMIEKWGNCEILMQEFIIQKTK